MRRRPLISLLIYYVSILMIGLSVLDAFGEQGRPSQGEETAVPPDATLYVHLQFVCWIRQIGEDQGIAKKTLSIGNSQRIHTQSQAVVKGTAC